MATRGVARTHASDESMMGQSAAILVIEDEPSIAGFIRRGLVFEGYSVEVVGDGPTALSRLRDEPPDLVILDVMLPGLDGFEITRRLRAAEDAENRNRVPLLMLTARDAVKDRVTGLESGADDYLVKPFAFDELLARVRALLRRVSTPAPNVVRELLHFADIEMDLRTRLVRRGEREMRLTTREFDLLALFLRHPNQVLQRAQIMSRIWGDDFFGDSNVLEVFVGNLRRELEAGGEERVIQTVRGAGYVLREQHAR